MKTRLFFVTVLAVLFSFPAAAQKPEFTVRANVALLDCSVNLTGGIQTTEDMVFGLGAGWGQHFFIYSSDPAGTGLGRRTGQRLSLYLYHRLYVPMGKSDRFSFYGDIMAGGLYVYKMSGDNPMTDYPSQPGDELWWLTLKPGKLCWYLSWQPGIAIRLWEKTNFFAGLSVGPSIGFHSGITF